MQECYPPSTLSFVLILVYLITTVAIMNGSRPCLLDSNLSSYGLPYLIPSFCVKPASCGSHSLQTVVPDELFHFVQNKLRHGPNQFQTWSQFLYRLSTILDVHNTAFICPVYDEFGEPSGVYVPLPSKCEIVQYGDKPYLRYKFNNGQTAAIEMDYCGVMSKFQLRSDFFGENNSALLPTMELVHIQNQGIKEGVKNGASYKFYASVNNFTKADDLARERKRFSEENFSKDADGGGILLFPNTYTNINQVKSEPWVIDDKQMEYIRTGVYEYFMVNEDVLTNKAYGDKWTAFYEGAVEPFAIQFSEVMTRMLFTFNEQTRDNRVIATANRLQYMSNQEKLNVSSQLADRGILNRDEVREIWNLAPLPDGEGQEYIIRGEYYNATEKITEGVDENGTE